MHYLIIPGLGNSGPEHWQTYFESKGDHFIRVQQSNWDTPDCQTWINKMDEELSKLNPTETVMIGHSLGCTAIVQWYLHFRKTIKGALMVAPSDIEAKQYTFTSTGFTPIPLIRLPFPSIVVSSDNDEWVSLERAKFFAEKWGSTFINIGNGGHINTASGHYQWDEGFELLKQFEN